MKDESTQIKRRKVLVTAALPYSNGRLHVGHLAGAYIPADIYVRYLRLCGTDVRFVCGSDDHGVAIMITADKEGKTPAEVADFYRAKQAEDFKNMGISFDIYSGTSINTYHTGVSQSFFRSLHAQGYFTKKNSRQFYDEARNVFLPDRYVKGRCGHCGAPDQNGDQCENCGKVLDIDTLKDAISTLSGKPATIRETVHWFLDLSRFKDQVEHWLENARVREQTKANVRGLLASGLVERAMTRDLTWGIPVPLDDPDASGKVLYVWFDAPIGYISNTLELCAEREGDPQTADSWWRSDDTELYHFIGEDNTIFHCVIWIAMLQAEGTYTLPRGVIVNQFLNIQFGEQEAEKISKSRGTAIWIGDYIAEGGSVDALRYYLTSIAPEKARTVYKPEDFEARYNGELADTLGNLVNRVVAFSLKYFGNNMPTCDEARVTDRDERLIASLQSTFDRTTSELEQFSSKSALECIMEFARECNRYLDEKAPWTMRKTDSDGTQVTLYFALRAIHGLGIMLLPFMPSTANKILGVFGRSASEARWQDTVGFDLRGFELTQPEILFQKTA